MTNNKSESSISIEDVSAAFPGSKVIADEPFNPVLQARQFLKCLYGDWKKNFPGQFFEIRLIFSNRAEQMFYSSPDEFIAHDLRQLLRTQEEDKNFGIFFGLCPRLRQSGKNDDIKVVPALWADLDGENSHNIYSFTPPADIVVASGNGKHGYWIPLRPLPANEATQKVLKRLQRACGSDSVSDYARVMRLPGSQNLKTPTEPKLCKVTYFSRGLGYAV